MSNVDEHLLMEWMDTMELMRVVKEGSYQYTEAVLNSEKAEGQMMALLMKHNEQEGELDE